MNRTVIALAVPNAWPGRGLRLDSLRRVRKSGFGMHVTESQTRPSSAAVEPPAEADPDRASDEPRGPLTLARFLAAEPTAGSESFSSTSPVDRGAALGQQTAPNPRPATARRPSAGGRFPASRHALLDTLLREGVTFLAHFQYPGCQATTSGQTGEQTQWPRKGGSYAQQCRPLVQRVEIPSPAAAACPSPARRHQLWSDPSSQGPVGRPRRRGGFSRAPDAPALKRASISSGRPEDIM